MGSKSDYNTMKNCEKVLKLLKVNFEILKCDFDESNFTDESPEDFVIKNTQQKCFWFLSV